MKRILAVAAILSVTVCACVKNAGSSQTVTCTNVEPYAEQSQILAFLSVHNLSFNKDTSGVYYRIDTVGTGNSATITSTVSFTYVASLLDGSIIDKSTTPITYPLASTIPGFGKMAGYFKTGTHIKLVIPSSLAYGCEGLVSGTIGVPANAILYYDLVITAVQ